MKKLFFLILLYFSVFTLALCFSYSSNINNIILIKQNGEIFITKNKGISLEKLYTQSLNKIYLTKDNTTYYSVDKGITWININKGRQYEKRIEEDINFNFIKYSIYISISSNKLNGNINKVSIILINIYGITLFHKDILTNELFFNYKINSSKLHSGLYILLIDCNNIQKYFKFNIE